MNGSVSAAEKSAILAHLTQQLVELEAPSRHEVIAARIADLRDLLAAEDSAGTWDSSSALDALERAVIAWDCTYAKQVTA